MAKNKNRPQGFSSTPSSEEQDSSPENEPKEGEQVLNLSRMYTLAGKHWGPGEEIIPENGFNGMSQDEIIRNLEEAEGRNAEPPPPTIEITEKSQIKTRIENEEQSSEES